MSENNSVTVVIVGGGVAGLSAAKELAHSKISFILVEAQDYLGGRVRTIDAASDLPVDLGAQYILGETNNAIYTICKQLNCIVEQDEKKDLYLLPDGSCLDDELIQKIWQIREEILEDAKAKSRQSASQIQISLFQHLKENYTKMLNSEVVTDENLRRAIITWLIKLEEVDIGCQTLTDVSLAREYYRTSLFQQPTHDSKTDKFQDEFLKYFVRKCFELLEHDI